MDVQQLQALQQQAVIEEREEAVEPQGPSSPDKGAEAAAVVTMVVALLSPLLPYLPGIYTDDKVGKLGAAWAPVAEKYGWDVGGWLSDYGAEIALFAVAAPLAMQTAKAHRGWAAEMSRAAAEKQGDDRLANKNNVTRGADMAVMDGRLQAVPE